MTIEKFKRLTEANGAYLIYFTDESRVDIFKDGRSLGYVHLTEHNKADWYGGPLVNLMFILFEFAETPIDERGYPSFLVLELAKGIFNKDIKIHEEKCMNKELEDTMRKILNLPPYNTGFNPCWNDHYAYYKAVEKYGEKAVLEMEKKLKARVAA